MEHHQEQLLKSCRVCGKRLHKANKHATSYSCEAHVLQLLTTFGVDVSGDVPEIHPPKFCMLCYSILRRATSASQKGASYSAVSKAVPFQWSSHTDPECPVRKKYQLFSRQY